MKKEISWKEKMHRQGQKQASKEAVNRKKNRIPSYSCNRGSK